MSLLCALYNRARPQGLGFLEYEEKPMTKSEAASIIRECEKRNDFYFDYLKGRVMKVSLKDPRYFDERLYDRDNGAGAAALAIKIAKSKPVEFVHV